MISARDVIAAAELLTEREEIAETLAGKRGARRYRIEYLANDDDEYGWLTSDEYPIAPAIVEMLVGADLQAIAEIDARLRKLGVEPPSASEAHPS